VKHSDSGISREESAHIQKRLNNNDDISRKEPCPEVKIVGECRACNGRVVCKTERILDMNGSAIAFKSDSGMEFKTEYYCRDCGLRYKFPPKDRG